MVASMDSVGKQPEVYIPLDPVNPENGLGNQDLDECSGRSEQNECTDALDSQMLESSPLANGAGQEGMQQDNKVPNNMEGTNRYRKKFSKKKIVIAIIVLLLVLSLPFLCLFAAPKKPLQATSTPNLLLNASCPQGWISDEERYCYFFSDTESTWDLSLKNCSSSGGSLPMMDTSQEMDFINKNKDATEYWIGLRREKIGQPWKWTNGTEFNKRFVIKGDSPCATLNDGVQSSTDCDQPRNWICRKPLHGV
ncbi:C-type lectin domain family 2 member D-like isoform X2 [Eublepharis macularius]|uniref:C-type lectin domain family 2 member D-like isoform X2 n=1 Tax=Eublepharis macularius TaxID=481883 RepID=A0AA97JAT5_EUBMA|nr:C-type lectin domain family 2 member D-like isoform X2 [Eublepharis macularius]XP_054834802.1 C-type lectin domain family 2 member D-like isoform X2 [Eublepharis macularius]